MISMDLILILLLMIGALSLIAQLYGLYIEIREMNRIKKRFN